MGKNKQTYEDKIKAELLNLAVAKERYPCFTCESCEMMSIRTTNNDRPVVKCSKGFFKIELFAPDKCSRYIEEEVDEE